MRTAACPSHRSIFIFRQCMHLTWCRMHFITIEMFVTWLSEAALLHHCRLSDLNGRDSNPELFTNRFYYFIQQPSLLLLKSGASSAPPWSLPRGLVREFIFNCADRREMIWLFALRQVNSIHASLTGILWSHLPPQSSFSSLICFPSSILFSGIITSTSSR